jgi:hypothetical protein
LQKNAKEGSRAGSPALSHFQTLHYLRFTPFPDNRNLAHTLPYRYYRLSRKKLEPETPFNPNRSVAMFHNNTVQEGFEISPRFRRSIEDRIARLEQDARLDEASIGLLDNPDHIRRQTRLVAAQRFEALRMRIFLDRARIRPTQTINAPPIA